MLDNNTVSKLREMKMSVMATAFQRQLSDKAVSELSYEERVGLMVDAEWTSRRNNRLDRLLRSAGFSMPEACVEDIEYHPDRELDKALITRLSTCNFVEEHHNVIILGATGSGKSYLANAFGVTAARNFHTARYVRLPDLLSELAIARAEGTSSPPKSVRNAGARSKPACMTCSSNTRTGTAKSRNSLRKFALRSRL